MNLTNRQQQVYEVLKKNPNASYSEIESILGCTRATISLTIHKLQAQGIIKLDGDGGSQKRELTNNNT